MSTIISCLHRSKPSLKKTIVIFPILFLLISCGGSSDSDSSGSTNVNTAWIQGVVALGLINDAVIDVYTQDGQTLLVGGLRTGSDGKFQTYLPPGTEFPVLVKSSGGNYIDEYTGQLVQLLESDSLYAYSMLESPVTPLSNAMKVTIDKMVEDGYISDIKTAYERALFQYTNMLGFKMSDAEAWPRSNFDPHSNLLGGFSKLVDDLNTYHAGAVPTFDLIKDMIHDLGNDGVLDGIGSLNGLTSIFSGGAGDLASATDDYLSSINMLSGPTQISPIDFNQTLFVVTNIVGPGGSLVITGPDANLFHGGTLYVPKSVIFNYEIGYLSFDIFTSEVYYDLEDIPSNPPPEHRIQITHYYGVDESTTINVYDSETGNLIEPFDYDTIAEWTSAYHIDFLTGVDDVPGISFDIVNQRIIFDNVTLYKYTNDFYIDYLLINPPVSIILNGEITY